MAAFDHFLPRRGRHIVPEEGPHFLAKRDFFLAETEIHRVLL
jgi:hypothetical protein